MGSRQVLLNIIFLTSIWILWKSRINSWNSLSLAIVVCGGELYEESLTRIFHKLSPFNASFIDQLVLCFSKRTIFNDFCDLRVWFIYSSANYKKSLGSYIFPIAGLVMLFFTATSRLFLEIQLPSDVFAGYVFGGVWLGLNILLLEIFRLMRSMDKGAH